MDKRNSKQGTTTVIFTDVVYSSAIANAVGDRVWTDAINWHIAGFGAAIEKNGGNLVKTLGDGTMSIFSSARSAMNAARQNQKLVIESTKEPQIDIPIGLHTGDVIQSKGDFFSGMVNKAAGIASAASPGKI